MCPYHEQRLPSATHGATAAMGLAALLLALCVLRSSRLSGDDVVSAALFVMAVTAGAIFLVDLGWQKVHHRLSTGMDFKHNDPSQRRALVKYAGLLGSLGFVVLLYWLFPEYHGSFYGRYYQMLCVVVPPLLLLGLPYIYLIDRHMPEPRDGLWHMGMAILLQWDAVDRRILGQHVLGWMIKGFFLPLMFTSMCNGLGKYVAYDLASLTGFKAWFDFLYDFLYFIDVALVSMGYLMTLRLSDTHIRSAEPTLLGWAAALVCYEPFWSLFGRQYLAYDAGSTWGKWLWDFPITYCLWGGIILALVAVYVTNGPYRWTKHPAYIAKNLTWWLISVPFLSQGAPDEVLRHCLLLLGLNGIYLLRAKTEEWHLSRDPDYLQYARWIDQHGLFRWARPLPSFLVWRP